MKRTTKRIRRLAAGMAALLLAVTGLGACGGEIAQGGVVSTEPLPELTDDRKPTDVGAYADRLEAAFSGAEAVPASDLTYTVGEDGVTVTAYTGGELVVVIPDTVEGRPVVSIGENAFAGLGTLRALSLPDTVTVIGKGALTGCDSLSTLRTPVYECATAPYFGAMFGATSYEVNGAYVPGSLTTLILTKGEIIPDYAFHGCRSLEALFLPETVTAMGDFAFYGCESLVYLPLSHTTLTEAGEMALANCSALLDVSLPATVTLLGEGLLEGCGKLESLTLPFVGGNREGTLTVEAPGEMADTETRRVGYLGYLFGAADYTFTAGYLPASLMTVELLPGCGDIPANAFFECASIREVILPRDGSVTAIGHRAFYGCARLSKVYLPASVTTVGDDAYHGCVRLVSLEGGEGLTTLGVQAFMDCVSLPHLTLPAGVTRLPNACFAGCVSLETLTAPGVTEKGTHVFRGCEKLTGWDAE